MSESGGCPSPRHGQEQLCLGWNAQPGAEGAATAAASAGEQHPSVRLSGRWTSRVSYGNPTYRKREEQAGVGAGGAAPSPAGRGVEVPLGSSLQGPSLLPAATCTMHFTEDAIPADSP